MPICVRRIVNRRDRWFWKLLAHGLELLITGGAQDYSQARGFGEFESKHGDATSTWQRVSELMASLYTNGRCSTHLVSAHSDQPQHLSAQTKQ